MGLVAGRDGNLAPLAEGARFHVNYLFTFRRPSGSVVQCWTLSPGKPACDPGWRGWRSPLGENTVLDDLDCDQLPKAPLPLLRTRPGL